MQLYTIGEAAQLLRVSTDTARRWADAGRFPILREGNKRMIEGVHLAAFCVALAQESAEGTASPRPRRATRCPGS